MGARRISFVNFKGGVGKTSLVVNLAACLAHDLGKKVLVVDCDPQSNASIWLMGMGRYMAAYDPRNSTYGVLTGQQVVLTKAIKNAVVQEGNQVVIGGLDLLPSCFELMDFESDFTPDQGMLHVYGWFHQNIKAISGNYDYILFDCPPNVYRASKSAIYSSGELFIPCNPDALSNMGLSLLRKKMTAFYEETREQRRNSGRVKFPKIRGVLINRKSPLADESTDIQKIRIKIQSFREYKNIACEDADIWVPHIRQAIAGARAAGDNLPLIITDKHSKLAQDYIHLARLIDQTPME